MRVLIADDDPVSLRLLEASLDKMRHEVLKARDGREAWELYQTHDIPLVITDWLMPHMSGIELCQAIRAEARHKYSYVVIVTTLSDNENTLEGFRAGADDYLVKPLRIEHLQTRIAVAERVHDGMDAKVEMTLRGAVELCTAEARHDHPLLESVKRLADFYRAQRAHSKAAAFLRRQITLAQNAHASEDEVAKLRGELESLLAVEDGQE